MSSLVLSCLWMSCLVLGCIVVSCDVLCHVVLLPCHVVWFRVSCLIYSIFNFCGFVCRVLPCRSGFFMSRPPCCPPGSWGPPKNYGYVHKVHLCGVFVFLLFYVSDFFFCLDICSHLSVSCCFALSRLSRLVLPSLSTYLSYLIYIFIHDLIYLSRCSFSCNELDAVSPNPDPNPNPT